MASKKAVKLLFLKTFSLYFFITRSVVARRRFTLFAGFDALQYDKLSIGHRGNVLRYAEETILPLFIPQVENDSLSASFRRGSDYLVLHRIFESFPRGFNDVVRHPNCAPAFVAVSAFHLYTNHSVSALSAF